MKLLLGDCKNRLKDLDDESVDAIVTDPPYELGFMGKAWDSSGIAYDVEMWKECFRVLKKGGHLISFGGSRTYHRMACAVEDAGFEIRDQIMWVYGSGFPKSHNIGHKAEEWDGWGTALKPAHEPIVLARKPFKGTVVENVLEHGTGGINIDECRVDYVSDYDKKHQEDIARGQDNANNGVFFGGKGKTKASTHEPTGRFPANFIHDGSDEVVELFPDSKAGEPRPDRGKGGIWNEGNGVPCGPQYGDKGSASRFFYCAKPSKRERNMGLENNTHATVKPIDLMRYLCRLITPPNGVVLDPFMGSGSTGVAALLERFDFIGIELEEESMEIAKARIDSWEKFREIDEIVNDSNGVDWV